MAQDAAQLVGYVFVGLHVHVEFGCFSRKRGTPTDIAVKQTGQEGSWHTVDIQCCLST